MSGQWPPEWDDPDDSTEEAGRPDAETEAGLSEVAAFLASLPAPVMPGSVEARIGAALAVEAAARSGIATPASGDAKGNGTATSDGTTKPDGAAGARVLGPAPARARVRRREMRKVFEPRRQRDMREVLGKFVIGPLAVFLLVGIIALGLSRGGSSSSSSSSSSSANSAAAAPQAASAASSASASGSGPGKSGSAAGAAAPVPSVSAAASEADFTVTQTGTSYQRATLAQQARAQVLAARARASDSTTAPSSPTFSVSTANSAPTAQLHACVLAVTGGVPPKLVDRATYQGTPAYVIATSSHVWVVGLGCTAARPQVLASVPLAG
jgi:hypothetical protein